MGSLGSLAGRLFFFWLRFGFVFTFVRRGSRVIRCMGRIRKEIMGRFSYVGRFSIFFRIFRKAVLLFL